MKKTKKIFITGYTGQIGREMVNYLRNKLGIKKDELEIYAGVRRVANRPVGEFDNLVEIVDFDLSDPHSISGAVSNIQPDIFFNFGAMSHVHWSWEVPRQTFDVDAGAVLDILESIRLYSPDTVFFQLNTSEMFGDVQTEKQNEKTELRPRSPYAAAKCAAHHLVKVYRESYGLKACAGIMFNSEGIYRSKDFVTRKITSSVARISNCIKHSIDFDSLELGNLDAKRDWSAASDSVRAIWKIAHQEDLNPWFSEYKDYVIGSGRLHSVRDFVQKSFAVAGIFGAKWVQGLAPEDERYVYGARDLVKINSKFYRPAEVNTLYADYSELKHDLDWNPKTSFQDLVKLMTEYDLKNV